MVADEARRGIDRRTLIKGAAVAGAAAWTAPMIVDSLTSPAAASSGGLPTTCSYALVVFSYYGYGPFIMKIDKGSASCSFTNSTSNDTSFSPTSCGSYLFRGGRNYNAKVQYSSDNGSHWHNVSVYPSGSCDNFFTVSGSTVTRDNSNVSIIFAASHYGNAFHTVCPPSSSSVTVQCSGGGAD